MGNRAVEIVVSQRQRELLEKWVRSKADTPYRLIERCRIIVMSADGISNYCVACPMPDLTIPVACSLS